MLHVDFTHEQAKKVALTIVEHQYTKGDDNLDDVLDKIVQADSNSGGNLSQKIEEAKTEFRSKA